MENQVEERKEEHRAAPRGDQEIDKLKGYNIVNRIQNMKHERLNDSYDDRKHQRSTSKVERVTSDQSFSHKSKTRKSLSQLLRSKNERPRSRQHTFFGTMMVPEIRNINRN